METNTFAENWTCLVVLKETAWGKMFVLTVGSFHIFIKMWLWHVFYMSKSMFSPKHKLSCFFINDLFLWRTQICEASISTQYEVCSIFFPERTQCRSGISSARTQHKREMKHPRKFHNLFNPLLAHIGAKLYVEGLHVSTYGRNVMELCILLSLQPG